MLMPIYYITMSSYDFDILRHSSPHFKIKRDGNDYRIGSIINISNQCNVTGFIIGPPLVIQITSIINSGSQYLDHNYIMGSFIDLFPLPQ